MSFVSSKLLHLIAFNGRLILVEGVDLVVQEAHRHEDEEQREEPHNEKGSLAPVEHHYVEPLLVRRSERPVYVAVANDRDEGDA